MFSLHPVVRVLARVLGWLFQRSKVLLLPAVCCLPALEAAMCPYVLLSVTSVCSVPQLNMLVKVNF